MMMMMLLLLLLLQSLRFSRTRVGQGNTVSGAKLRGSQGEQGARRRVSIGLWRSKDPGAKIFKA
jgi:hypothetical protein